MDRMQTLLTAGSIAFHDTSFASKEYTPHLRSGIDLNASHLEHPPMGVVLSSNSMGAVGRAVPTTIGVQASGVAGMAAQRAVNTNIGLGKLIQLEWDKDTEVGRPPQLEASRKWNAWVPHPFNAQHPTHNIIGRGTLTNANDQTETQHKLTECGRCGQGSWKSLGVHRRSVGKVLVATNSMPEWGSMKIPAKAAAAKGSAGSSPPPESEKTKGPPELTPEFVNQTQEALIKVSVDQTGPEWGTALQQAYKTIGVDLERETILQANIQLVADSIVQYLVPYFDSPEASRSMQDMAFAYASLNIMKRVCGTDRGEYESRTKKLIDIMTTARAVVSKGTPFEEFVSYLRKLQYEEADERGLTNYTE